MKKLMNAIADKYDGITDEDIKTMMKAWEENMFLREIEGYNAVRQEYIPEFPEPF